MCIRDRSGPTPNFTGDRKQALKHIESALYASKIISYAQGFMLMQAVSRAQSSSSRNIH